MSAPSQHDRIEIWRYTYARSSLIEASEAAKFLVAHPPPTLPWQVQKALVGQIVTAYARPFTKSQITASKRIIPLAEEIVPTAFQDLHSEHLEMRNRAIGHKDAVGFPATALNRVLVHVNNDTDFELLTISPDSMTDSALHRTVELCQHLVAHCEAEVLKYASHFFGVGAGDYFLSIEESPTEWLKRNN